MSLFEIISKIPFLSKVYVKASLYKQKIKDFLQIVWPIYKQKIMFRDKMFLVLTPEHDNLGDHAIALAEKKLFASLGLDFYEISEYRLREIQRLNMLGCFNKSTVFVHGGGYLGTIWLDCELLLRELISANPKSHFLALPNTLFYENTDEGKKELKNSQNIYNAHESLILYAREKNSYVIMKELYRDVRLAPDMVFTLNESDVSTKRNGCLLCLRNDREKTITNEQKKVLLDKVELLFKESYAFTDMSTGKWVSADRREAALEAKFSEFRSAELVITDRLHGMIFCAITGTPCIVINSKSHKVKGCYEWIKDLEYIHFAYDIEQIPEIYHSIPKKVFKYNNQKFEPMFNQLKNDIVNCVNKKPYNK